jgi:hypothetical protein
MYIYISKLNSNLTFQWYIVQGTNETIITGVSIVIHQLKTLTFLLKQKKLILSYSLINDSTLIGVFWEKGQAIERFDEPTFCTGTFDLYNTNIKGELKINFKSEILGVYHLKK